MESLSDPRTKGFKDGKFGAPTLEAWLSLENDLDTLMRADNSFSVLEASTFLK